MCPTWWFHPIYGFLLIWNHHFSQQNFNAIETSADEVPRLEQGALGTAPTALSSPGVPKRGRWCKSSIYYSVYFYVYIYIYTHICMFASFWWLHIVDFYVFSMYIHCIYIYIWYVCVCVYTLFTYDRYVYIQCIQYMTRFDILYHNIAHVYFRSYIYVILCLCL